MSEHTQKGWHWPRFERALCGTMNDRERLGLPDRYVADRFGNQLGGAIDRVRALPREALAQLCESRHSEFIDRLAAGTLLALLGDPRIDTLNPAMVTIDGGEVEIGLPFDEVDDVMQRYEGLGLDRKWIEKECPRHRVRLAAYAIGKYPVTHREYRDFLLDSGYAELPSCWQFRRYPIEYANHPVYTVSAQAAKAYCAWLAAKTGRAFRLPTEAEWEYAAAGPQGLEFPWGAGFDADRANTCETGLFQTTPVGIFPAGNSPFGVADMAGNVEEYVADVYAAYPGGRYIEDHLTEIQGDYHVARGGSFARFRDLARNARRHGQNPRSVTYAMGLRVAEDLNTQGG